MNIKKKVLFLYGKLGNLKSAVCYCTLHKCFISKYNLVEKKFKCRRCKYREEIDGIGGKNGKHYK